MVSAVWLPPVLVQPVALTCSNPCFVTMDVDPGVAMELPQFITALQRDGRFDHPVDSVQLIQTHISYVLLAGSYVYKIKKPVDLGFLDFTTLEKRAYFCQREIELNRRLCPDVYLARLPVTFDGAVYQIGGGGEVVDYAVKMHRLPQDLMMGRLLSKRRVRKSDMEKIVDVLVPFYQAAAGGRQIQSYGGAAAVRTTIMENLDQTRPFVGSLALSPAQFDRIRTYTRSVLQDEARFTRRVEGGHIKDCHGDLYSANICLGDQVYIFDCIEFNDRLRYTDVAADIAFLAMDLDFHGCGDLASFFVERFARCSGDMELHEQVGFYKCYRAFVRGKIGMFTSTDQQLQPSEAARSEKQAGRYFQLAEHYARTYD